MRGELIHAGLRIVGLLVTTVLLGACAPTATLTAHPQLQEKPPSIRTVTIVPPKVDVSYENLARAVEAELSRDARFVIELLPSTADALLVIDFEVVDSVASPGIKEGFLVLTSPVWLPLDIAQGRWIPELSSPTPLPPPRLKVEFVETATNTVLWSSRISLGSYDLRNRGSTAALVKEVFKDFPRAGGSQ